MVNDTETSASAHGMSPYLFLNGKPVPWWSKVFPVGQILTDNDEPPAPHLEK
jgi:hypothetical protein